jgi:hypothetical protein
MLLNNIARTLDGHGKRDAAREFRAVLQAVRDLRPAPSVSEETQRAVAQILRNSGEFCTANAELDFRTVSLH